MQKVISCIELASVVTEQLAPIGNVDKQRVVQLCTEFLENIKASLPSRLLACAWRVEEACMTRTRLIPVYPPPPRCAAACALQGAQLLVQEGLKKAGVHKAFDASSYHAQTRAQISMEKVRIVSNQLSAMQEVFQQQSRPAEKAQEGGS